MILSLKERTLRDALEYACCRDLPKIYCEGSEQGYWIEAIVLVKKCNGDMTYTIARRGGDGMIRYVKDFGRMSGINGLVSIHPYLYLDKSLLGYTEKELSALSDEERVKAYNDAILRQRENKECDMRNNYYEEPTEDAIELKEQIESLQTEIDGTLMRTDTGVETMVDVVDMADMANRKSSVILSAAIDKPAKAKKVKKNTKKQ